MFLLINFWSHVLVVRLCSNLLASSPMFLLVGSWSLHYCSLVLGFQLLVLCTFACIPLFLPCAYLKFNFFSILENHQIIFIIIIIIIMIIGELFIFLFSFICLFVHCVCVCFVVGFFDFLIACLFNLVCFLSKVSFMNIFCFCLQDFSLNSSNIFA